MDGDVSAEGADQTYGRKQRPDTNLIGQGLVENGVDIIVEQFDLAYFADVAGEPRTTARRREGRQYPRLFFRSIANHNSPAVLPDRSDGNRVLRNRESSASLCKEVTSGISR